MAENLLHDQHKAISQLTLIPSSGGVFEVTYGDTLIESKKETGNFPSPEATTAKIDALSQ